MYRLLNPFEDTEASWIVVSEDKTKAFAAYFRVLATPNEPISKIKFKGLDPEKNYSITGKEGIFSGDELMYSGLVIPDLEGDYQSITWVLKSED